MPGPAFEMRTAVGVVKFVDPAIVAAPMEALAQPPAVPVTTTFTDVVLVPPS
jgi:hypothetical protein